MYPELQKLPLAVQQMIHDQYQAALKRFEEGRSYQISTDAVVIFTTSTYFHANTCSLRIWGLKVILSLMMNAGMILQTTGRMWF